MSYHLVKNNFKIVNGYGKGVGSYVINGVARYCYQTNTQIGNYLTLMPFPTTCRDKKNLLKMWNDYREEMISQCGIGIFISGNKVKDSKVINADGMIKEYEIAENNDLVNIPLKFTGGASKDLYEDNQCDLKKEIQRYVEKDYRNKHKVKKLVSLIKKIQTCEI